MDRILVGIDGSAGAANALRWASHLAAANSAELLVTSSFVPTEAELPPGRIDVLRKQHEQLLEKWCEAAMPGQTQLRTTVERGDARVAIPKIASREGADLVVIGRVGSSTGPGIFHLGSTADHLAHTSQHPLAVIGGAVNLDVSACW